MTTEFPAIYCVKCGRRLLIGEANQCIGCVAELAEGMSEPHYRLADFSPYGQQPEFVAK